MNVNIYKFVENDITLKGEKHHLVALAETIRAAEDSGFEVDSVITDLISQIEYAFDIDGVRSEDEEL